MSHRSKTYVARASEDDHLYQQMATWRADPGIDFRFCARERDAAGAGSPEAIRQDLRRQMACARQVVLIGSPEAKRQGSDGSSALAHEVAVLMELGLPVVVANHDGTRAAMTSFIPQPLLDADYFTVSVALGPAIVRFALDTYAESFATAQRSGPHFYEGHVYDQL